MITIEKGDLLKSDCTIICHQANCMSTMGSGIAKQIKEIYPEAYEADKNFKSPPRRRLGQFSFVMSEDKKRIIFNLYGQFRYGYGKNFTDSKALKNSMEKMFQAVKIAESKGFPIKLGMPYKIGCGRAGGNWEDIYGIIEELSNKYERNVYLYEI